MEAKTVNVIEVCDADIIQIISFIGDDAEKEAKEMFKTLILEHHDPENNPPRNVLGFGEETLDNWSNYGRYDDQSGYSIHIVCSRKFE